MSSISSAGESFSFLNRCVTAIAPSMDAMFLVAYSILASWINHHSSQPVLDSHFEDAHLFKRKKWTYMILDEAHHIKNFETKRWQTLLTFQSKRRLLLTGTPLQNNLMELWSLMHFLMPHIFQSHAQFKVRRSRLVIFMISCSFFCCCCLP